MTDTQEQWDIVSSVGLTAVAVAAGRAIETHRPNPLTQDPYAESLVRAAAPPVFMPTHPSSLEHGDDPDFGRLWGHLADRMAVRTRFFDQFFQQSLRSGATQAVILAAGLDTRAFRLSWPEDFRVFEIDQPRWWISKTRSWRTAEPSRTARAAVSVLTYGRTGPAH